MHRAIKRHQDWIRLISNLSQKSHISFLGCFVTYLTTWFDTMQLVVSLPKDVNEGTGGGSNLAIIEMQVQNSVSFFLHVYVCILENADFFPTRHTTYYCYRFGNLTAWAINCKGIQHAVRYIRDNNLDLEILTGSHWFSTNCD